jgi:hypothetical protein
VPPGFPGFAIFGSLAILENFFSLDPLALRHQISLILQQRYGAAWRPNGNPRKSDRYR